MATNAVGWTATEQARRAARSRRCGRGPTLARTLSTLRCSSSAANASRHCSGSDAKYSRVFSISRLREERLRKGHRPMLFTRHTFFSVVTPTRSSAAACCRGRARAGRVVIIAAGQLTGRQGREGGAAAAAWGCWLTGVDEAQQGPSESLARVWAGAGGPACRPVPERMHPSSGGLHQESLQLARRLRCPFATPAPTWMGMSK